MFALPIAYALGYRKIHLFGYDSSYADGQHHAFKQELNDAAQTIDIFLEGKKYTTTPMLAHQVAEFCGAVKGLVGGLGVEIELHCDGLLPDFVAYSNRMGEMPLEERERRKYEEMWTFDKYRKESPGEALVDEAVRAMTMKAGDSVIDFGCGSGKASRKLQRLGMKVTAVDFAANALDDGEPIEFVNACLWDMPEMSADYGYCTDVMEHIPTEKVIDVLRGIHARAKKATYFNIATEGDRLGGLIGKKLHMTVMEAETWQDVLAGLWRQTVMLHKCEGGVTFVCFN
jgi:hypothetical protein